LGQKLAFSFSGAPQWRQKRGAVGLPQVGQKRALGRIAAPQDWQRVG